MVTAPRWAFYGLSGEWEVENHGIAPDIEIDQDPKLVREGHDPQLERAVAVAFDELKKNPPDGLSEARLPQLPPDLHRHPSVESEPRRSRFEELCRSQEFYSQMI
ncbi:MAG: hypothetical protein M3Y24_01890 [Acidobacteriota bacterium]|nr:hypothetical protein [Acidobacteriota bacterium]